ncbi:MAG TPA: hypothetical protein VK941_09980 [Gillisia sp.]|nr:hypothetical protein [Gillisia sp.]
MRTTLYKLLFILVLSPSLVFCTNFSEPDAFKGRHTKEKKITKQFNVAPDALLKINNSYGNLDITTWDENRISIEVIIKTNGNDEQKVKEKLDEINVEFNQTTSGVSARTRFTKENSSWWSSLFSGSSNVNMEINYIVRAPATNNVDLSNDYGNIFLDKLTGNARISCDYGRMDIKELHGSNNQLNFDYSRNSQFGYINKAVINADYSEFTVDDAKSLKINADYTNSNIRRAEVVEFSCDYGSLTVDKVKRIAGSGDYLSTKIGDIHHSADLNMDYGSLAIGKVIRGAGEIKINSDYTGLKIGYDREHSFRFAINANYANVKGMEAFEINKQNQGNTSKSYEGFHLNNSGNGNINITSSYGSVSFQQQ